MTDRERFIAAVTDALRAPDGDLSLTAIDFASIGEIAHEAADRYFVHPESGDSGPE